MITIQNCPSFNDGECRVASQLAGMTVHFDVRACDVCKRQPNPQTINKVTRDIAAYALRKSGKIDAADALIGIETPEPIGPGVGKTFADAVAWIDLHSPGCLCRDHVLTMNKWGPEKCLQERSRIAAWFERIARNRGSEVTKEEIETLIAHAADQHLDGKRLDSSLVQDWPFVWTYWAGGAVGDELRYSIRSVLTHQPDARVIVVGDKPQWYTGEFIRCPRLSRRKHHAFKDCYHKLLTAARQIEQFVWMMDDVYWIAPFEMQEAITPKYVRHVSQQRYYAWKPKNAWARTRAGAYQYLLENNLPTYDFAAHLPQPIVAETFLAMEERLKLSENYRNWESIYFNSYWSNKAEDYGRRFLRVTTRREKIETKHKLLNHIHSQFKGAVADFLTAKFPSPSPVEKPARKAAPSTATSLPIPHAPQTEADWDKPDIARETVIDGPGERIRPQASTRVCVDFVLPYGPSEVPYMPDAFRSVGWQQSADIHLHLIPDAGAPRIPVNLPPHVTVHWYERTDGKTDRLGPYRIANAIAARHTRTPWMFICDADDISLPTRAWESVATAERHGCEQIGGEVVPWIDDPDPPQRLRASLAAMPRCPSGTRYEIAPLGTLANATRCIAVDAFRRVGGFEDWQCSADFEFDTRSRKLGIKTYAASAVWGLRRIRTGAATNSEATGIGTPARIATHEEMHRRLSIDDQSQFGAMHRDVDLLQEVSLTQVGFLAGSYSAVGGVSVWHQTLIPRLSSVAGFVCLEERFCDGDLSLLGCAADTGLDAARELAARCDVLVVWGIGERLGNVLGGLPEASRPKVIGITHSDHRSQWTAKAMEEEAPWTDQVVYLCPSGLSAVPQQHREAAVQIPNAPDPARVVASKSRAKVRRELGIPEEARLLLTCSRISPEKRIERLVDATKALPDDYHLVIAGRESRWAEEYGRRVRGMLSGRITLIDPVASPANLLAAADAYVTASEQEGYGLATAEAMLAGVPVIATRTGLLESEPILARIVDHDASPSAWASAIEADFAHTAGQRARADAAQEAIRSGHSVEAFADAWQRLIDRTAAQPTTPARALAG